MAKEPWLAENWWVSPHNFAPEALQGLQVGHPLRIHDVTLRDGEECSGVVYSVEDKVEIAKALAEAGVPRFELMLTTPGSREAVKAIQKLGLGPRMFLLSSPALLQESLALGASNITLVVRSSEVFISKVLKQTKQAVLEEATAAVRRVKRSGAFVNFFMADSTRSDLQFLQEFTTAAEKAGADAVTIVDTLSIIRPQALAYLVRKVKGWVKIPVELHCHNDYGLAVANALVGYTAGASVIHASVNGLGYRCGNPALEEVVMALEALYRVKTGIKLEKLYALSQLVQERSGLKVAYNKPIVGEGAFTYEQYATIRAYTQEGIPQTAFPYLPKLVGREPQFVISKWADLANVEEKLREAEISASLEQTQAILAKATQMASEKRRPLRKDEFLSLARQETGP